MGVDLGTPLDHLPLVFIEPRHWPFATIEIIIGTTEPTERTQNFFAAFFLPLRR
jgi:hypothetical protein